MFFLSSYDHFQRKLIIIAKSQGFFPWLFSLSWEQRKFSEVVETRRGLTYKPSDIRRNGVRVLRSSNIDEDRFVLKDDDVFVDKRAVNINYVKEQDILITAANGSSRLVGKHAIISQIPDYSTVHGGFMLLGSAKEPDFINASMGSFWYKKFIDLFVAGGNGAIGNLNKNDLDNQDVLIPSETEQRKIGSFFRSLDDLITLHQHEPLFLVMLFSGGSCVFKSAWEQRKLSDYLTTSPEKNISGLYTKEDVLSVSGDVGIVNQIEFQGRSFAGASVLNYGIVETGDVVYTKSPLRSNPYGIIKANKGKPGIVSTLYAIYHPSPLADSDFIQCYFEQDARVNNYLHPLVNKGAKNDMKVSADNALKGIVRFPSVKEQQTISSFFKSLDDLITLHQREHKSNFRRKTNVKQSTRDRPFLLLLCSVDKGLQRGSGP